MHLTPSNYSPTYTLPVLKMGAYQVIGFVTYSFAEGSIRALYI